MFDRKFFLILIIIADFVWSISAFVYDLDRMSVMSPLLWPFIVICPILPLILATYWIFNLRGKGNKYLVAFAAIPSTIYLIAALIYYPLWMTKNGFDLLALGQIFWVLFYGLQGVYILVNKKIAFIPSSIAILYLWLSFAVQYNYRNLGYYDMSNFSSGIILGGYFVLFFTTLLIGFNSTNKL